MNDAIRIGLTREKRPAVRRFVQKSFSLGAAQYFRWDKALAVAETIEDEEHKLEVNSVRQTATLAVLRD